MIYVIGDVHGKCEQLKDLIKKMKLRPEDELYILGDIIDRGPDSVKALRFLMSLPNCHCIAGNHEVMLLENMKFLMNEITDDFLNHLSEQNMELLVNWINNGASGTISEFSKLSKEEMKDLLEFVGDFEAYAELEVNGQKYLLVHAGLGNFAEDKELYDYAIEELVWTRADYEAPYYQDVIVVTDHTPTQKILNNPRPGYIFRGNNHIAMDCGACYPHGRLAGICLETGEEFYSDC